MSMSEPDDRNSLTKWMNKAMVICCIAPITIALFLGGELGVAFGHNEPTIDSPPERLRQRTSNSTPNPSEQATKTGLYPAIKWRTGNHTHGLSVNPTNAKIIYLATHHGLIQRTETGKWLWMQPKQQRADYMGFTTDPTNPNRFYASGHPQTGGNLGFQVSGNLAQDWQQLSMPGVDFHALAVAPSNPKVFYGFPASGAQGIQISIDGGKTWKQSQMNGLKAAPFNLVVDPVNADRVFAVTAAGLYQSTNRGETWGLIPNTQKTPVVGLALQTEENKTVMYGFRAAQSKSGIDRSVDGGETWQKWGTGTKGIIIYLAIAPSNPKMFYAVNRENAVFQSQDGGKTWKVLG